MRLTKNRLLILRLLDEEIEGSMPPHSVCSIHYTIQNLVKYKWQGYPELSTVPDKRNINRTCIDLLNAGLLVVSRVKDESFNNNLPYWEKCYQLASSVERNFLIRECDHIYRKVNTAKNGVSMFGMVLNKGLPDSEVKILGKKVKVMLQRTHPDKIAGYEYQFKLMRETKDVLKSGIPSPEKLSSSESNHQQSMLTKHKPLF